MSTLIRPFARADRASLARAIDAVCAEGRWMSTPCFQPTPVWTHALETPNCSGHLLLIAEDRNQVIGWCRCFPIAGCNGPSREAELGIGMLPQYRERGLGRALISRALDWAVNTGLERVTLKVRVDNSRAIHLFESRGFTVTRHENSDWQDMTCRL